MSNKPIILKGYITDMALNSYLGPPDAFEINLKFMTDKLTNDIFKIKTNKKLRLILVEDFD